jgi:uncharacterized hydrophobic protein (TIGR00271 family)
MVFFSHMLKGLFDNVTEAEKNDAIERIIQHASPRRDFFLMLTLSVSMAAFGILLDSTIILIGSMLIAPLLYPLLSTALGVIVSDEKLILRSLYTVAKSVAFALAAGFLIGFLFSDHDARSLPAAMVVGDASALMYAVVAAIAGFAAAFAVTKSNLSDTLPGVAISVALVPPLAAAGIGLAFFDWQMFSTQALLFLVNIIGIVFSAMIVFALFRFSIKRTVTQEVVKKEEKVIEKEAATNPAK